MNLKKAVPRWKTTGPQGGGVNPAVLQIRQTGALHPKLYNTYCEASLNEEDSQAGWFKLRVLEDNHELQNNTREASLS